MERYNTERKDANLIKKKEDDVGIKRSKDLFGRR